MTSSLDCSQNTDPLKLVREGTSREQRLSPALDPAYAPVDERTVAHGMVFARAYAAYLRYYNLQNVAAGDWQPFFSEDVSVRLAVAAVQDVEDYRQKVREYFNFLNDRKNRNDTALLRDHLDYLFSCCATLAIRLDLLKEKLPVEIVLQNSLQNLIKTQLAPALKRLIAYHKGGEAIADAQKPLNDGSEEKAAPLEILGEISLKFSKLIAADLSKEWTEGGGDWTPYYAGIAADDSVYGTILGTTVFDRINHIATHNLFTSIFDQFLKVYARTVSDASRALEDNFKEWDRHEPHYALFLTFLRLFEYARTEANTLTARHLDFYYRHILQLNEKPAEPGKAHLLVELAKQAQTHLLEAGELFKAGKDDLGSDAFFANNRDFVANQAKVAALKTVYRHGTEKVGATAPTDNDRGRFFASPVANSDDGLGAELTAPDQSWHPFFNKIYRDGVLSEIGMPKAEIGFAIASHYLWMAEGTRTISVAFTLASAGGIQTHAASKQKIENGLPSKTAHRKPPFARNYREDVICLFTTEKGWFEKTASAFFIKTGDLRLEITLSGEDPAIAPYSSKTHGYDFATDLPILLVKLRHRDTSPYLYAQLQDLVTEKIDLNVQVEGLKTLAVSNDFGPLDTSKPFQPYGALPVAKSALVVGSTEVFQKKLLSASVGVEWLTSPAPYPSSLEVTVDIDFLTAGQWVFSNIDAIDVGSTSYDFTKNLDYPVVDEPDLTPNEFYNTASRHGFARLRLTGNFGQNTYQADLIKYLRKDANAADPGKPPIGPSMSRLWMDYSASQTVALDSLDLKAFNERQAGFFHLAPFGQAEQHPVLNSAHKVYLLPPFDFHGATDPKSEAAEFYIGVTDLSPPQNLALLFQAADGTADPLSKKPVPHIHWSYLGSTEWMPFAPNQVQDQTGELLNSGIITFAMPREASAANTLLPTGMYWIRAAVATECDAACRLLMVAAQALEAVFTDKGNDLAFPAKVLPPGTINKLDEPDAAVKTITQPFPTFGGRGKEAPTAFYTRISERLRHKDRAIDLWDYERLVLEAFPQIYKAKCLNHTHYEPDEGFYRELAPGHVTVVTIPNQQFRNLRDPLRPYTSLGLLEDIASFLRTRLSCFVKLHVKNPQFEEVRVGFKVRLYDGFDETFYSERLQEAITRFLSPWAFADGSGPSFGGKIYKAVLIDFVEELPYVDYVTDFQLFHVFLDSAGVQQTVEENEIEGSKALSILVSARKHTIETLKPAVEDSPGEKCPCEA